MFSTDQRVKTVQEVRTENLRCMENMRCKENYLTHPKKFTKSDLVSTPKIVQNLIQFPPLKVYKI
jgi:hypothetical protein